MARAIKNQLSDYGFNLIALPKEGISPLLLLYKNKGDVSSAGINLEELFGIGDFPPPTVKKNIPVANLERNSEVTFDAEVGINLLDWLLQKLKMGKLTGEFSANSVKSITISYKNILQDDISLGQVDNFLTSSKPEVDNFTTFRKRLEKSQLYVVSSILKSNGFSISATNNDGQKADLEATIKAIVDANVKVERGKENSFLLEHTGASPLVFAFKAQRIIYDDKKWWEVFKKKDNKVQFKIKDQQGVILKDDSDFPTQPLELKNEMVDI